jgi:hypothetical protein
VGRCITAGCPNWSEDTICADCVEARSWSGRSYGGSD